MDQMVFTALHQVPAIQMLRQTVTALMVSTVEVVQPILVVLPIVTVLMEFIQQVGGHFPAVQQTKMATMEYPVAELELSHHVLQAIIPAMVFSVEVLVHFQAAHQVVIAVWAFLLEAGHLP